MLDYCSTPNDLRRTHRERERVSPAASYSPDYLQYIAGQSVQLRSPLCSVIISGEKRTPRPLDWQSTNPSCVALVTQ
jgi:hypothetical protein